MTNLSYFHDSESSADLRQVFWGLHVAWDDALQDKCKFQEQKEHFVHLDMHKKCTFLREILWPFRVCNLKYTWINDKYPAGRTKTCMHTYLFISSFDWCFDYPALKYPHVFIYTDMQFPSITY